MTPVELVRDVYARFNAGERDTLIAVAHPEIEVDSVMAAVEGACYRGHDGLRAYLTDTDAAAWGRFQLRGDSFEAQPGGVLVVGGVDLEATASGIALSVPVAWLWTLDHGLVRRVAVFTDLGAADRAAGEP